VKSEEGKGGKFSFSVQSLMNRLVSCCFAFEAPLVAARL